MDLSDDSFEKQLLLKLNDSIIIMVKLRTWMALCIQC